MGVGSSLPSLHTFCLVIVLKLAHRSLLRAACESFKMLWAGCKTPGSFKLARVEVFTLQESANVTGQWSLLPKIVVKCEPGWCCSYSCHYNWATCRSDSQIFTLPPVWASWRPAEKAGWDFAATCLTQQHCPRLALSFGQTKLPFLASNSNYCLRKLKVSLFPPRFWANALKYVILLLWLLWKAEFMSFWNHSCLYIKLSLEHSNYHTLPARIKVYCKIWIVFKTFCFTNIYPSITCRWLQFYIIWKVVNHNVSNFISGSAA